MTLTFEKGPPIFSPTFPMLPSGLNCLPIAPADETTDGFCVCLFLSTLSLSWDIGPETHLGAAVFGLASRLRSSFDSLVGHSAHLYGAGSALGDGDAPGDGVSGCQTKHVEDRVGWVRIRSMFGRVKEDLLG